MPTHAVRHSRCMLHSPSSSLAFSSIANEPLVPGPVVTFLSPNPHYSRSAVHFLHQALNFPIVDKILPTEDTDRLNKLYNVRWNSEACVCPFSNTVLHFLSLDDSIEEVCNDESFHSLIAIHGGMHTTDNKSAVNTSCTSDVVLKSRMRLAEEIQHKQLFQNSPALSSLESRVRGGAIRFMNYIGRRSSPSWILQKFPTSTNYQSVLFDLKPFSNSTNDSCSRIQRNSTSNRAYQLRELAIPFFPEMSSIQQQLSKSSLTRPAPGLYQFTRPQNLNATTAELLANHDGLILRPIPSAPEDFKLPHPSLVIQCSSLVEVQDIVENKLNGRTAKIGWRGDGENGSLIVSHPSVMGLDIRLVETSDKWVLNTYFDEAQEALLAASLDDLQSSHVITEGNEGMNKDIERQVDPKNLNADCWVETRANVKNPLGFLSKKWSVRSNKTVVAKPPDLPYE